MCIWVQSHLSVNPYAYTCIYNAADPQVRGKRTVPSKQRARSQITKINQFSRELAASRRQLVHDYKYTKQNTQIVKWLHERNILVSKIKEVRRDAIKDIHFQVVQVAADTIVKWVPSSSIHGNSFQGSIVNLRSTDHVISKLHAVNMDTRVARVTYNMYTHIVLWLEVESMMMVNMRRAASRGPTYCVT